MKTSNNSKVYPLVSVDWLNNYLSDPEILVFDIALGIRYQF